MTLVISLSVRTRSQITVIRNKLAKPQSASLPIYLFFLFSFFTSTFTATGMKGELVVMEPWRCFKVLDPGVVKDNVSIVPLKMLDQGLVYEKEIPPGVSRHIIKELKLDQGSAATRVGLLTNLLGLPFNSECTLLFF